MSASKRFTQSQETRTTILDASLRLFVHKGYGATTVRDIAAASQVSTGLMFHYFDSKQSLLEAHVRQLDVGMGRIAELIRSSNTPLQTFELIATMLLGSLHDEPSKNLFLLATQVQSSQAIPEVVRTIFDASKTIEASVPLIVLGQQRAEIREGDPEALAIAFWGALQGIAELLVWRPEAAIPEAAHIIDLLRTQTAYTR